MIGKIKTNRPYVLSLAGFDPSMGAGLGADVKTFEKLKCYGLAVSTGNTVQNDNNFKSVIWTDVALMKEQISLLFERFTIDFVKIGIVESWAVLNELMDFIIAKNKAIKFIIDPVLNATGTKESSWHQENEKAFQQVLDKCFLITPNLQEIANLFKGKSVNENIKLITQKCNLYLKGGHAEKESEKGKDYLYLKNTTPVDAKKFSINPKLKIVFDKHGSGCVLASAITANLAKEVPLLKACYKAKMYTEGFLSSNKTLLGYHY